MQRQWVYVSKRKLSMVNTKNDTSNDNNNNPRKSYKKFKFDHTNKWYSHNPESAKKNETHKVFWNFRYKLIAEFRPDDQTL